MPAKRRVEQFAAAIVADTDGEAIAINEQYNALVQQAYSTIRQSDIFQNIEKGFGGSVGHAFRLKQCEKDIASRGY